MVLVYDRPLLRSSARGDGALTANNDRFAIGLRAPGCEHLGYALRRAVRGLLFKSQYRKVGTDEPFESRRKFRRLIKTKCLVAHDVNARMGDFLIRRDYHCSFGLRARVG